VLGGWVGRVRYYADGNDAIHIVPDSLQSTGRNSPKTALSVSWVRETALTYWIPAAWGLRRGGQGYVEKHYSRIGRLPHHRDGRIGYGWVAMLILQWRARRGQAVLRYTVDAEGEAYDLGGLVDGEPWLKGQVVRVVTTGGWWLGRSAAA